MDAGKRWMVRPEASNIAYLKSENAQGRHILIQHAVQGCYLIADDIAIQLLHHHHQFDNGRWKPGRMVVETSPGNYQVWIHAKKALSLDEKRYWLKKMSSDPGSDPYNRWGRCPSFRNRKQNIVILPVNIHWQSLSGLTGNYKPTFQKLTCQHRQPRPHPFPLYPWRGACAMFLKFIGIIMIKEMNLLPILPMPWLCSEKELPKRKSEIGFLNKEMIGRIILVKEEEMYI